MSLSVRIVLYAITINAIDSVMNVPIVPIPQIYELVSTLPNHQLSSTQMC